MDIFMVIFLSVCEVMLDWSRLIRSHYQECVCPQSTVKWDIAHHVKYIIIRHWETTLQKCYCWLNSRNACKHNKRKYLRCLNGLFFFFFTLQKCPSCLQHKESNDDSAIKTPLIFYFNQVLLFHNFPNIQILFIHSYMCMWIFWILVLCYIGIII